MTIFDNLVIHKKVIKNYKKCSSDQCVQVARRFYEDNGYLRFCSACSNPSNCVVDVSLGRMVLVRIDACSKVNTFSRFL